MTPERLAEIESCIPEEQTELGEVCMALRTAWAERGKVLAAMHLLTTTVPQRGRPSLVIHGGTEHAMDRPCAACEVMADADQSRYEYGHDQIVALEIERDAHQVHAAQLVGALERIARQEEAVSGLAPQFYGHAREIARGALAASPAASGRRVGD